MSVFLAQTTLVVQNPRRDHKHLNIAVGDVSRYNPLRPAVLSNGWKGLTVLY